MSEVLIVMRMGNVADAERHVLGHAREYLLVLLPIRTKREDGSNLDVELSDSDDELQECTKDAFQPFAVF